MTPRTTVRGTDNSRLLESRDTHIPDKVGTLTRTSDASRKRASPPKEGLTSRKREASPLGSPERPTYARTFTGDTDYNPQPQWDIQEIPRDTWVPNPLQRSWCCPQLIVLSITSCKRQRSECKLQGAVSSPGTTADTTVHTRSYVTDRCTHRTVCHTQCGLYSTCGGWLCCG